MVLFYEDEEKERKAKEALQARSSWRFVKFGLRIVLTIAFLFSVGLFILHRVGGSSDSLKAGAENYLSGSTGLQTSIGTLEEVLFFPVIRFVAQDISFNDGTTPVAQIGNITFGIRFWDIFFGRQQIAAFAMENVKVQPGHLTAGALDMQKIALTPDEGPEGEAVFLLEGTHDGRPLEVRFPVIYTEDAGGKGFYTLQDTPGPFAISLPGLSIEGQAALAEQGGVDFMLEKPLTGRLSLTSRFFKGDLKAEGASHVLFDLRRGAGGLSGDVKFPVLDTGDIAGMTGVIQPLLRLMPPGQEESAGGKTSVDISIEKLQVSGKEIGNATFPVRVEKGVLRIDPLKGKLSGGTLSGDVTFDTKEGSLAVESRLKDWDYGFMQQAFRGREDVSGTADINLSLKGSGKTDKALLKTLSGEASLIAGQGQMASSALNFWGTGLVNAVVPNLDSESETTLNCAIAAFKVADGIAVPETLFLDTKRVTVTGEGEINLSAGTMDLKLSPKSKDPALLDVTPAVNLKGPLSNPSIAPDTLSLGKTIGGLVLGAVNPAFLALSLTDMGLGEDHPCHAFVGETKATAESSEE